MTLDQFVDKWRGTAFATASGPTPEFVAFARAFKAALSQTLSPEWESVGFSRGHFELSGFLQHQSSGQYVYWHISDVRFSPDEWATHVLIRTATHAQDYTGGLNHYTPLDQLESTAARLLGV